MSILPSFVIEQWNQELFEVKHIDPPQEYGIDFQTGTLTGEIVEGKEAVKVWIWLALQVPRYRYGIYSWQYGAELEAYIGQSYSQEYLNDDVRMEVEDCLKVNPHINGITDFQCQLEDSRLTLSMTVDTDYGEVMIKV